MPETNSNPKPTIVDLFCGAGGLSYGFQKAGFSVSFAADFNSAAVETYNSNFDHRAEIVDLSSPVPMPSADVVVGGPPCQGFSSAGARRPGDRRNNLVSVFAEKIVELRPRAFVFENVEGFLTGENGGRVLDLLEPVLGAGYRVHLRKVNAANFGVPQHRKRVIAIGGLGWDPSFPISTHTAFGAPGAMLASKYLPLAPSLIDALADLAHPPVEPPGFPQGHFYRPLTGVDLDRAEALKPGMTMRDLPEALHHESYRRRANRRVMDGTPTERRGGAPAGIRRLRHDEPSKAVTGGARSEFLHPFENRNLTIRECARLQTFPDDFHFFGTVSEQMQLIGNAVPPLFALQIARSLSDDLATAQKKHARGRLLSFVPTLSNGYSPALQNVVDTVNRQLDAFIEHEGMLLWG
ncbi:MAG: DNA cytosine methyltransferase [Acidobacteriaceae bacterium]